SQQVQFLRAFDLGFMRRRLRFVVAAFNWWYRCVGVEGFPTRENLDTGKTVLYQNIATLDALAELQVDANEPTNIQEVAERLRQQAKEAFPQIQLAEFLATSGADGALYATTYAEQMNALLAAAQAFL